MESASNSGPIHSPPLPFAPAQLLPLLLLLPSCPFLLLHPLPLFFPALSPGHPSVISDHVLEVLSAAQEVQLWDPVVQVLWYRHGRPSLS